jgi:hypothetical protein
MLCKVAFPSVNRMLYGYGWGRLPPLKLTTNSLSQHPDGKVPPGAVKSTSKAPADARNKFASNEAIRVY